MALLNTFLHSLTNRFWYIVAYFCHLDRMRRDVDYRYFCEGRKWVCDCFKGTCNHNQFQEFVKFLEAPETLEEKVD